MTDGQIISGSPEETFELGAQLGKKLRGGEVVLLTGGLGAGKTLLTKGILSSLDFDVDEVTSPSFALVNLYRTDRFNIYHIDLWRSEGGDAAFSVGLEEILEEDKAIVVIEWAERLGDFAFHSRVYRIDLVGDGEEPRLIGIRHTDQPPATGV
ncbi:MAG: tRNA (adenosine(37)-N6)-threonylcarbamoyltransferase complex ATPase subunit type 1 TsaE [Acidobacteriota bacterium]